MLTTSVNGSMHNNYCTCVWFFHLTHLLTWSELTVSSMLSWVTNTACLTTCTYMLYINIWNNMPVRLSVTRPGWYDTSRTVLARERHRLRARAVLAKTCVVTFREFHGPGPAEGTGQPVELYVELLHRPFHHKWKVHRDKPREQSLARPVYLFLMGLCCSWASSMGAGRRGNYFCVRHTQWFTAHSFLLQHSHQQLLPSLWHFLLWWRSNAMRYGRCSFKGHWV